MLHVQQSTAAISLAASSAAVADATVFSDGGNQRPKPAATTDQPNATSRHENNVHSAAQPLQYLQPDAIPGASTIVQAGSEHADAAAQCQGARPPAATIALTMTPLCLSVLLSALDLTIVTPAIPVIVGSFQSTAGYVWIGSGFVLASTAATPVWGSVADIWGRKPIILGALSLFLLGSLICALAPEMGALVAGRVVQGLGASGMGTMVNVIICDTFSLRDRGLYLAVTSLVWAVGSAVGPVIGGSFTNRLEYVFLAQLPLCLLWLTLEQLGCSWRWCFWVNRRYPAPATTGFFLQRPGLTVFRSAHRRRCVYCPLVLLESPDAAHPCACRSQGH